MVKFNDMKLRGRIREKLKSEAELARQLGMSRSMLSARFNGVTPFTREEIWKISRLLGIVQKDIGCYFFLESGDES